MRRKLFAKSWRRKGSAMSNDDLRERLVELEGYPEELRRSIEAEVARLKEQPLRRWVRAVILFWCVPLALVAIVFVGHKVLTAGAGLPSLIRIEGAVFLVMMGAFLVWCLTTLRRGSERARDDRVITNVAFGFVVLILCASLLVTQEISADLVAGIAVVGFAVTWARIKTSELQLRENILRLELRMIDLMKDTKSGPAA
jgi:FtsH-binding integral membrane protein